eukprot:84904-Amphidinium_carterae.1
MLLARSYTDIAVSGNLSLAENRTHYLQRMSTTCSADGLLAQQHGATAVRSRPRTCICPLLVHFGESCVRSLITAKTLGFQSKAFSKPGVLN